MTVEADLPASAKASAGKQVRLLPNGRKRNIRRR